MAEYDILRRLLSDRVIAFHPEMARALGGVSEALLMQQLMYWSGKGSDPEWIYKTREDLTEETTLSRYQQEQARAKLRALGVIEEEKRGLPAKLYYRVVWPELFRVLETHIQGGEYPATRMQETDTLVGHSPATLVERNSPALRGTTEKTAKKTTDSFFEKDPPKISLGDRATIERYAGDFAAELNDSSPITSTVTRLCRTFAASGLDLDAFLDAMVEARKRTQAHSGSIRTEKAGPRGQTKSKVAYWIAVVEDITASAND